MADQTTLAAATQPHTPAKVYACADCGGTVSARAEACPHCGCPIATKRPTLDQRVTVVDLDISFGSLIWLMVKGTIAAIPAMILLAIIGGILSGLLAGIFRAATH